MSLSNKDLGAGLIGAGIIVLLFSIRASMQLLSTVSLGLGKVSLTATDIPPVSAVGIIVGVILVIAGVALRKR